MSERPDPLVELYFALRNARRHDLYPTKIKWITLSMPAHDADRMAAAVRQVIEDRPRSKG